MGHVEMDYTEENLKAAGNSPAVVKERLAEQAEYRRMEKLRREQNDKPIPMVRTPRIRLDPSVEHAKHILD